MTTMTMAEAIRQTLRREMQRDARVILLGEDIGVYGGAFGVTRGLLEEFGPDRVRNTPISEMSFTGVAIGAALAGLRPIVEIMFMDFITLVMDPLVNWAAKLHYVTERHCPLVVRTPAGGGRGYGPTHSQSFEAWFLQVPGLWIAVPSAPADAVGLLRTAIRGKNPVLFVEHKRLYGITGEVAVAGPAIPFGRARRVRRGRDLTMVAWSRMVVEAMAAADRLSAEGLEAEVLDLRTLTPLDLESVVESVRRTHRLLIVDEGVRRGGVAADLAAQVGEAVFEYLDAPIRRVTAPDIPIPAVPILERAALPDADRIAREALRWVREFS